MLKNAFYFTSKALFFLKVFNFLSWLFGRVAKQLDLRDKVNFKIYGVTAWLTNNCNTNIARISRSKGNQAIKFGQLTDYKMRNIFLEKSYTHCGAETSPRPFYEKLKLSISLDQLPKVSCGLIFLVCQVEDYRNILKLGCNYLTLSFYKKQKEIWG